MISQNSRSNWLISSTPTAAVITMALLLSKGNPLTTVGVGITAASSSVGAISVLNRRRDTELERLKQQLRGVTNAQQLEAKLSRSQSQF